MIKGILAVLAMVMMLGGCGATGQQYLDLSEKALDVVPEDIGRFSAHVAVRRAEESTKKAAVLAEKANEDADRAFDQKAAITNIDTDIKALAAANIEQSRTMRRIVRDLSKAIGGKNQFELATTPTPKGAVSEGIDSVGNAAEKIARTPAALATSVGVFISKVAEDGVEGAGDKTTTSGDQNQVSLEKTNTSTITQSTNTGTDGVATGTTAGQQAENTRSDDNSVTDTQP